MKAISTVIASILMLMIVVALGGTTWLYVSGIFTGRTATAFEVIDAVNDTVTIRNSGTEPITRITATLDGDSANIAVVPNIQGLVSYWSFNEGGGITTDDNSYNNNVGTLINGPSWVDGKYGKALQFDGVDDYVNAGNDQSLSVEGGDMTVEVWYKPRQLGVEKALLSKVGINKGFWFSVAMTNNGVQFLFNLAAGGNTRTQSKSNILRQDTWVHLVFVKSGTAGTIYADGVNQTANTEILSGIGITTTENFCIGSLNCVREFQNALIDEVRIYNRALTAEEIKQVYSGLVSPGQLTTIKTLTPLSKGTHTLRLCTSSMCNTGILTIN